MNLKYPYQFASSGRTAQTDLPGHIADMIEQILMTAPGERVNRPTFGTGTAQLVFAPNSDALAAAQQQVIQGSLQQGLSDLIRVNAVDLVGAGLNLADYRHLHDHPVATAADPAICLWRSSHMIYFCSQKNRRALVLQHPTLNGIDYLEVSRTSGGCGKRLFITMLKDARGLTLTPSQVSITGGGRAPI